MSVKASAVPFNEAVLRLAVVHGKEVEFRYVKSENDPPQTRRFVPESITQSQEGMSFRGNDTDREAIRTFRVDRIRGDVRFV